MTASDAAAPAASLTEGAKIATKLKKMSYRSNPVQVARSLAIALMAVAMLAAQPGFAAGVGSAWAADDGGCSDCPCEAAAEIVAAAERDEHATSHDSDGCPEGGCPVGCDECTCCPGATLGVTPSLARCRDADPGCELLAAGVEEPMSHLPERLFKPPRASCS